MKFSESLKKNDDFKRIYNKGRSKANRYFVLYVLPNGTERNRLGISVSKKVGNSVVRHHLARLIREAYRLHEDMFHSGWDMVVLVRTAGKDIDYHNTVKNLLHLSGLQKILKNDQNDH
ncbi:MAG: ribonuclease P protein component [Lachnospiraceae bacterium]|nr:ribonuclease P protein component [Lachnospiraceae bacterium]